MANYRRPWLLYVAAAVAYVFLFAPITLVIINSFNSNSELSGWGGFTFRWYGQAWGNSIVVNGAENSLLIAVVVTAASAVLGTGAALALHRSRRWTRAILNGVTYARIVIPELVIALALLIFFSRIGFPRGVASIILGHIVFDSAYVTIIVSARLASRDAATDEAARDLGATPWRAFRRVLLPDLMPAIITSALLAFTFSLDDVVTSFFLSGSVNTLPLVILSLIRQQVTPAVNALGVTLMAVSTTMMGVFVYLNYRWSGGRLINE
jgi:spermidine/putrescine transport system permease protein